MPRRRCLGGCGTLITKGTYCPNCHPYNNGTWKVISAFVLRRDNYNCRCGGCKNCERHEKYAEQGYVCVRVASTADHIKPVARGGSNAASNLRAMCRECNSARNG